MKFVKKESKDKIFPTIKLSASKEPLTFKVVKPVDLTFNFIFRNKSVDVDEFLSRTGTSALLIVKD